MIFTHGTGTFAQAGDFGQGSGQFGFGGFGGCGCVHVSPCAGHPPPAPVNLGGQVLPQFGGGYLERRGIALLAGDEIVKLGFDMAGGGGIGAAHLVL